jgi:hypothetical protein
MRFIERRMSEERFAIEILKFMSREEYPVRLLNRKAPVQEAPWSLS